MISSTTISRTLLPRVAPRALMAPGLLLGHLFELMTTPYGTDPNAQLPRTS
jgi:hypothetical protein